MASISLPLLLLLPLILTSTHLLLPISATDCAYPCLPPPQSPNNNNPSQPSTPYNYNSPPYWNYPPPPGNYNPPSNGFVYASPPPPNPIVPWYPWYYHPPPSASAGLVKPLMSVFVLFGCIMGMLNF